MMGQNIMHLVFKIFNMKKVFIFLICVFYTVAIQSQVIPIGTIIKGVRLPSVFTNNEIDFNNSSASLTGSIKLNDSKLSIIENGFIIIPNTDNRLPTKDMANGRTVHVSSGLNSFSITINDFLSNTAYKYRAYAVNSKGEIAYSTISTFTTSKNYCEVNPCKNSASCISTISGPLCQCTAIFCGPCCTQIGDPQNVTCQGGELVDCPDIYSARIALPKNIKTIDPIINTKVDRGNWSFRTTNNSILTSTNTPTR